MISDKVKIENEEVADAPAAKKVEESAEPQTEAVKEVTTPARKRKSNASIAPDKFDWDAFESNSAAGKSKEEGENEYSESLSKIVEKEVVEGTVTNITKKEVMVNIGYKSEGIIPIADFKYNPDLKVGDKVDVYVENAEDKRGQLVLSHKKACSLKSWSKVNEAYENNMIIKGYIKARTKGGMIVDVFGIEAFLPGSQIDVKPIRDYDVFLKKAMEFKVVKINQEFKNVVLSHKALIEAELEAQKSEIISKLEKGQVLEGTVKGIASYGVFVDLGGVDGLIHITDLSWGRINNPEEIVKLDEKINVVILDFDEEKKRIALGYKQLIPHPWDALDPNLQVGDKVKGKVVVITDYGAFVEIRPGIEGLIHVSEMSWSSHLRSAQDFLKLGDEVEAQVLTLDRAERKMSLGIKQLKADPWATITEKYPIGSKHTAIVRNFTNFGVFVELEEGVDGLVHVSDLSWTKKIKHPSEFTALGEKFDVVVIDIDKDNRRLSLGHKQLEENPWDTFETVFTVGSIHQGTIVSFNEKGATVALEYGIEGFAPTKGLVKEDGTTAKAEEKLDFKVIEFSKGSKKIVLSHSRIAEDIKRAEAGEVIKEKAAEAESTKKAIKKVKANVEKTTLGDISELADLKNQMEKEAKAAKAAAKEAEAKEAEAKEAETKE